MVNTIVVLVGIGTTIAGVIRLAQDPIGLGLLLGGLAALYVSLKTGFLRDL